MSAVDVEAWRGPQHEDDQSVGADDGTRWVPGPGLDQWSGWEPGVDGLYIETTAEMAKGYPEVLTAYAQLAPWRVDERVERETESWTEVRVTGQPDGDYSRYDVTFRDDHENWLSKDRIIELATELWSDVEIRTRMVHRQTWTSAWVDIATPS